MSSISDELVSIVNKLPEEQARELVDFARFLEQRTSDAEWERIINDEQPRPKLNAFVAAAMREGPAEPLDPSKL